MIFLVYSDGRDTGLLRSFGTDLKIALEEFAEFFGLIEENKTYKEKELLDMFRSYRGPEKFYVIITARGSAIYLDRSFLGVEDVD